MGIFNFLKRQDKSKEKALPQEQPAAAPAAEEVEPAAPTAPEQPAVSTQPEPAQEKVFLRIRFNRSFTTKLIQSDDKIKGYYGDLVNEFMRYKVKTRISWRYQTVTNGRKLLAKIAFRGRTLSLYLALDPAAYAGTKYKINDASGVSKNASVPVLYKLKNDRRCKYAKDLISALMQNNGLEAGETPTEDYAARYPYEDMEPLIERGLVKLLKVNEKAADAEEVIIAVSKEEYAEIAADGELPEVVESITVSEAEEKLDDAVAETFIQESAKVADKTKKDIVNIDQLSRYFSAGETVTVEEIRKRVPSVNGKTTYIKVLARGTLDKPLKVEADDFSPAAVKMIVLTGGTVSRSRK